MKRPENIEAKKRKEKNNFQTKKNNDRKEKKWKNILKNNGK